MSLCNKILLKYYFLQLIPFRYFFEIFFDYTEGKTYKKGFKELRYVYSVFKETQSFMTYVRKSKLDLNMDKKVNS